MSYQYRGRNVIIPQKPIFYRYPHHEAFLQWLPKEAHYIEMWLHYRSTKQGVSMPAELQDHLDYLFATAEGEFKGWVNPERRRQWVALRRKKFDAGKGKPITLQSMVGVHTLFLGALAIAIKEKGEKTLGRTVAEFGAAALVKRALWEFYWGWAFDREQDPSDIKAIGEAVGAACTCYLNFSDATDKARKMLLRHLEQKGILR